MPFWNPAKLDSREMLDKRVILIYSKESLENQLSKVNKKIDKQTENLRNMDVFSNSKSRRVKARITLDELCKERDTILRRINLIEGALNE